MLSLLLCSENYFGDATFLAILEGDYGPGVLGLISS